MHEEQLKRIMSKLNDARSVDTGFKVFGASKHKYKIKVPISNSEIELFEKKYQFELPSSYKEFLLQVGNGGAGPYYGLYPLGQGLDELAEKAGDTLGMPARIAPGMTDEEWQDLTQRINNAEDMPDEEFDQEVSTLYSGILPLGSQGCTYLHGLVVTGEYAGKVINVDMDFNKPKFCYENNFLDWYERWLDEVISGILISDGPTWFGYTKGGSDVQLLDSFYESDDSNVKLDALTGLEKLHSASDSSCERLRNICTSESGDIKRTAAQMLAKFSYEKSVPILEDLLKGCDEECKTASQAIFLYQKEHSNIWAPLIVARLKSVKEPDAFRFMLYVLSEAKFEYGDLLVPFCRSKSEEIRVTSYYSLGLLKNKSNYIPSFIEGLNDESPRVVHTTLQALSGVKSDHLKEAYLGIIKRFKTDEHYILTNLDHRLKDIGFRKRSEFINSSDNNHNSNAKKSLKQKISDLFK